jgi:hypothetical protein
MILLKLKRGIFSQYRKGVKGNKDTPYHIVRAKLTRNVDLAYRVPQTDIHKRQGIQRYDYGNLRIYVKDDTIVEIKNSSRHNGWFYKDKKRYQELNDLLGITDYEKNGTLHSKWWERLLGKLRFNHLTR